MIPDRFFMACHPWRPPYGPLLRNVKNCSRQFFQLRYANFVRLFSHSNMTPAIDLLKKAKAVHRVHSYQHDPNAASYGLEAAEKLKLEPAQVFKTLLAASEKGELLVAVVPVAGTLDLKALAQVAGVKKADMADPAAAQRATGYLLGGISPLGQKKRLRTFIDESAQQFPSIYVSAGRRGLEVELAAEVLAQLTQALFAPIGRG
jgi:Cys-tRNA(Pro)/Cys-tRNA(Cys) deacylase